MPEFAEREPETFDESTAPRAPSAGGDPRDRTAAKRPDKQRLAANKK
jgi:hypothetical protein